MIFHRVAKDTKGRKVFLCFAVGKSTNLGVLIFKSAKRFEKLVFQFFEAKPSRTFAFWRLCGEGFVSFEAFLSHFSP